MTHHNPMRHRPALCLTACLLSLLGSNSAPAGSASYQFGSNANGLGGQASATLQDGGATLSLEVVDSLSGAVLDERSRSGLGLNSRGVAGGVDPEVDKFNLLSGPPELAGAGEAIRFSFDVAGVLTSLDFDGVKDESFENFRLETPRNGVVTFFDSQIGLRLLDVGSIDEPGVTLLLEEPGGTIDDEIHSLAFAFAPGEEFTLIYGEYFPEPSELVPGFTPESGNGSRLQGLGVTLVPEPAGALLAMLALLSATGRARRIG
ncbi:hypothetical protein MalM25_04260 [Planctomycetes bacterium MalM25]|nr:hypothetical protein MalM25_04260 [Planctomycetes bacterium MalM25]